MKIKAGSIFYSPSGDYLMLVVKVMENNVFVVEEFMNYIMNKHFLDVFEYVGELE